MVSSSEYFSGAVRALFDAQSAFCASLFQALLKSGSEAAENHVDAFRAVLATSTVVTRQWLSGGWLPAVPSDPAPAGRASRD